MMTCCSSVSFKALASVSQSKSRECPMSLLLRWCTLATSFPLVTYMKGNGSWYFADDTHIKMCSTFEAINKKAYLLFYERVVSHDPVVEISQGISSFSIPSDTEQQAVGFQSHETLQVQHGTPPFFYVKEPWCEIYVSQPCVEQQKISQVFSTHQYVNQRKSKPN